MSKLPYWAQFMINTALSILVSYIPGTLEIKQGIKDAIISVINHFLGTDNPQEALKKIQDAHECAGIACSTELKK